MPVARYVGSQQVLKRYLGATLVYELVENIAPVATDDALTVPYQTAGVVDVLANDTDANGDTLTVTAASSPNGSVVIEGDNTLTFTPTNGFAGTTTISYTVEDGNGGSDTGTVSVAVILVTVSPTSATIDEGTLADSAVASIGVFGGPTLSLVGADAAEFAIVGTSLRIVNDAVTGTYDVTVRGTLNGVTYDVPFSLTVDAVAGDTTAPVINTFAVSQASSGAPISLSLGMADTGETGNTARIVGVLQGEDKPSIVQIKAGQAQDGSDAEFYVTKTFTGDVTNDPGTLVREPTPPFTGAIDWYCDVTDGASPGNDSEIAEDLNVSIETTAAGSAEVFTFSDNPSATGMHEVFIDTPTPTGTHEVLRDNAA